MEERFDQGGDLGRSSKVRKIFDFYGYTIDLTAKDSSSENGCVETENKYVARFLRCLLYGADLQMKFWPYAFQHILVVDNILMHKNRDMPPIQYITHQIPNISKLRIWGSHVWVQKLGKRRRKLDQHTEKGQFLGYASTSKHINYYDETT